MKKPPDPAKGRAKDLAEIRTAEPKARRTEGKAVRRTQLIEATISCIAKYGISGTTLARVTDLAGLSLGLANFHFASKDVLFNETLRFLASEHRDHWQRAAKASEAGDMDRLLAILDSFFHLKICSRKKLSVWFAFFGEASNRSSYLSVLEDLDKEVYAEILRLIGNIAAEGQSNSETNAIALAIVALMDGLWLNMLLYPEDYTRDIAKEQVRQLLSLMFPQQFGIAKSKTKTNGKA